MKLERLHEYVTAAVAIVFGVGFALFCATLTGAGQLGLTGALLGVAGVVALCIFARARIWLLIPLCWPLSGKLTFLPLPFTFHDIAIMIVFGAYLVLYALKIVRTRPTGDFLNLCVFANLLNLLSVYLRNPVGTHAMGSDMVGGYPYAAAFFAFLAYLVLGRAPADLAAVRAAPFMTLVGSAVSSATGLFHVVFPSLAAKLTDVYDGFGVGAAPALETETDEVVNRLFGFAQVGQIGIQTLCCYFAPITLLNPLYVLRFLAAGGFFLAILLSGFRTGVIFTGVCFVLATFFRRRTRDLVPVGIAGSIVLFVAVAGNGSLFDLPLPAQRALSFLPGKWDQRAVDDARGSSEWRYQMWDMVMSENKWIRNKWLGDGFGFSKWELSIMMAANDPGGMGFIGGVQQEAFLINGTFHNGPLSAIRYVGVVGLLLFYSLMITVAVRAWRLMRLAHGSSIFPAVLFVGIPAVYMPLSYTVVYGALDTDLPAVLVSAGLIKLLERVQATLKDAALLESKTEASAGPRILSPLPVARPPELSPIAGPSRTRSHFR